jgi:hypothetical protein
MGARADAARAEVLVAREALTEEVTRLEAAGRSAVDIPSKVRREPVKTAGVAAGAAFLVAGGPKRVFRRAKRFVVGPEDPLPKSMLPPEVDKTLRKMGTDGEKIRGTIEREFAEYLQAHQGERDKRDLGAVLALLLSGISRPLLQQASRRMVGRLFSSDSGTFEEAVMRIRARREAGKGSDVGH